MAQNMHHPHPFIDPLTKSADDMRYLERFQDLLDIGRERQRGRDLDVFYTRLQVWVERFPYAPLRVVEISPPIGC
jgi:hypothetical protein